MIRSLHRYALLLHIVLYSSASGQQFIVDTLASHQQIVDPGFLVFSPEGSGKFFVVERGQSHRIRVYDHGGLRSEPFLTLTGIQGKGQGLLALAAHPDYPDSPFVYVHMTRPALEEDRRDNLVLRFMDSSGTAVHPETLLVVPRKNSSTYHTGGALRFGPDGKLYVGVGDHFTAAHAQDTTARNHKGKILRLNPNGTIPADNPFPGRAFWSFGHRSTADLAFDEETGAMYCIDGGPDGYTEVNPVPPRGNLGWPLDGNPLSSQRSDLVEPLFRFTREAPRLTGIAVYRDHAFPQLRGHVLVTGRDIPSLWSLSTEGGADTLTHSPLEVFFSHVASLNGLGVGPDGSIYLSAGAGEGSMLLRLRPVPPVILSQPVVAARQDERYVYPLELVGTTPSIHLLIAPDGMLLDESTRALVWTPTNQQALDDGHLVLIRIENAAGYVDQQFTIEVENVNDPPRPFDLLSPSPDSTIYFSKNDPGIVFSWDESIDPDRDTVYYTLQMDTSLTFDSRLLVQLPVGKATATALPLPRASRSYHWRVIASDGELSMYSTTVRRLHVSFVPSQDEPKEEEKTESALEQNYPNPFNPATSIKYTIPKSGHVRLSVFNLLGQEVAVVFDGLLAAGTHEVEFKSGELPSGIYFYRILAPDFLETKKMIIAK
jgi:glucose/arabinose dehydrogenase